MYFILEIRLHIIQKLTIQGDTKFVVAELLKMYEIEKNEDYLCLINNYLIISKELKGLEYCINWIERNNKNPFNRDLQGLAFFDDIKALPYFLVLLELSYDTTLTSDNRYDRMWSTVINDIENLALFSKENYNAVITKLKIFIDENKGKLLDVEFINRTIEGIKEKFYKNVSIKYNVRTATQKIEKLLND